MRKSTKGWLAVLLFSTWTALVIFQVMNQPIPERVPLKFKSGQAQEIAGSSAHGSNNPFAVRLARTKAHEMPHQPSHNIFAPLDIPSHEATARKGITQTVLHRVNPAPSSSPAPSIADQPTAPPSDQEIAAQRAAQQAEIARLESMREMGAFRLFGFLEQNGVPQAFLARGNELYVVANGDSIDGRYMITVLDSSSVKIRATNTGVETTIGKSDRELLP
jgi:hypothetical protein